MEHISLRDSGSGQNIDVILHEIVGFDDPLDEYREVTLQFADGRRLQSSFWRDPMQRGTSWCEEPGMIIVNDLERQTILRALDSFLQQRQIDSSFEPIP